VIAEDADQSPLTYAIDYPSDEIRSLFRLSAEDGKLYALNPLDREQADQYIFYIVANDGLHKSSRVEIRIHVRDLNDEIPHFIFPSEQNDTLIIDRTYWQVTDYICRIDVQDLDQIPNHQLMLISRLDQLKNYDYLVTYVDNLQFDSDRFYLDTQGKLYLNISNGTFLDEGVYYLAFKVRVNH
jgi:hypothetical protein